MSIPWTPDTMRKADRGELRFSGGEIDRMLDHCRRRQIASGGPIADLTN